MSAIRPNVANRILATRWAPLSGSNQEHTFWLEDSQPGLPPAPRVKDAPPSTKKDRIHAQLVTLERAIDVELKEARISTIIVLAAAVTTGISTAGAGVLSNAWGVVTTVVAGGTSTTGLATATRDSLLSYLSLRTQYRVEVLRLRGKLQKCGDEEGKCLDDVARGIDKVYEQLKREVSTSPKATG
jgi:hypothetical protein